MKLQLHLATPVAAATPAPSVSQAGTGEVFRGAMQQLLAGSSSSMSAQLTQAPAVSASTAQPSLHTLPSATPVKGVGTNLVDPEQSDLEGIGSEIPPGRPPLPAAPVVQVLRVESANAKSQGASSFTVTASTDGSSVTSQSGSKRSVDETADAAVPGAAVHLPVALVPISPAQDVPAQGMILLLSPSPLLSPNPTPSLTMKNTTRQGAAQPEQSPIARSGVVVSNGLQAPGASSVPGTATVHDQQMPPGAASLPGVKASGIGGPADSAPSQAKAVHSQISTQGQPALTETPGGDAPHVSCAATDASVAGGVAMPAPSALHGTSASASKSPAREKIETKDWTVALLSTSASSAEHPVGASSLLHAASSGSMLAGAPADTRGNDAPARTFMREISAAQVLQKMDMSAAADPVPLRTDARHLNVGIQSAAYGWVEVRATAGASGHVNASLHVQSSVSAETLAAHSKDIASYAREQSIQMGQVSVGVGTGDGSRQNSRSPNSGTAQEGSSSAFVHSDAEIDEGTYRVLDTLSLISLRA